MTVYCIRNKLALSVRFEHQEKVGNEAGLAIIHAPFGASHGCQLRHQINRWQARMVLSSLPRMPRPATLNTQSSGSRKSSRLSAPHRRRCVLFVAKVVKTFGPASRSQQPAETLDEFRYGAYLGGIACVFWVENSKTFCPF